MARGNLLAVTAVIVARIVTLVNMHDNIRVVAVVPVPNVQAPLIIYLADNKATVVAANGPRHSASFRGAISTATSSSPAPVAR